MYGSFVHTVHTGECEQFIGKKIHNIFPSRWNDFFHIYFSSPASHFFMVSLEIENKSKRARRCTVDLPDILLCGPPVREYRACKRVRATVHRHKYCTVYHKISRKSVAKKKARYCTALTLYVVDFHLTNYCTRYSTVWMTDGQSRMCQQYGVLLYSTVQYSTRTVQCSTW